MITTTPLDTASLKLKFAEDQRLCIEQFWAEDSAQAIASHLSTQVEFLNAFFVDGRNHLASDKDLMSWTAQQRSDLRQNLLQLASEGVGFWYGRKYVTPQTQENDLLSQVNRLLNSEAVLAKVREISGYNDIICASSQATRYVPGSYLTRHRDVVEAEGRRLAYVLGFTKDWHPDWGGLLQFFEDDGTPRDAWVPGFNTMVLFDVRHAHSVTYVAPYAPRARFSITGWFRSVPFT